MGVLIGFAWFFASIYALVSLFRILPPFRKRSQAGLALGGIQIVAIAAAAAVGVGADQPPIAAPRAEAQAPQGQAASTNSEAPSYLVRIEPGERPSELPGASASDVASLKAKARAGLKTLDAAEVLLVEAVRTQRVDLARQAGNGASKVAFAMTADSKPLIGTAEYEKAEPCARAAHTLARLASSVAGGDQDISGVQDRLSLQERYDAQAKRCEAWAGG